MTDVVVPPEEESDSYWVLKPEQLRALVSARRHDIVDRLAANGATSIRELAAMIGAQPSALYHHVRQLLEVGIVVEAGHRVVRRKREQLYSTPARRMRLIRALQDPANAEVFFDIAAALTRQMDRDFRGGIVSPLARVSGEGRNLGMFRLVGAPDAETLAEINRRLGEIAELLWKNSRGGPELVSFAWIMAPIGESLSIEQDTGQSGGKRRPPAPDRKKPD